MKSVYQPDEEPGLSDETEEERAKRVRRLEVDVLANIIIDAYLEEK